MSTAVPKRTSVPVQAAAPPREHRPDRAPGGLPASPSAAPAVAAGSDRASAVRDAVVAGGAALGGLVATAAFAVDPTRGETETAVVVAAIAAAPERFYAANLGGAIGLVMLGCVGLATMRLVQERGRVLATAGGLLVVLGGIAGATGQFTYGAVTSVLAESEPLDTATRLQEVLGDSMRTGLPFVVGFQAFFLGLLLCAVALLRSGAVPRAVPAVLVAAVVAILALPGTHLVLAAAVDLLLAAGCAAVGVTFWRQRTARREPQTVVLPD